MARPLPMPDWMQAVIKASQRLRSLRYHLAILALFPHLAPCGVYELCPPINGRVGFLARGDCIATRAQVFSGHEWLTLFANQALPDDRRFTDEEIGHIQEGNRRVDWPKELLIHLASSPLEYFNAITDYHDAVENQPIHFLLSDRNTSPEATALAQDELRWRTREAIELWRDDRLKALTRLGQVTHMIQDSYSPAHARREASREDGEEPRWCVENVKAYIERAPGFLTPDIEFHGGDGDDTVGHATPLDSIYIAGRDCRTPSNPQEIQACLSESARQAVGATRDYFTVVIDLVEAGDPTVVEAGALEPYIERHLSLCPELR